MDTDFSESQKGFFEEIGAADVVVIIFATLGQCLVLDNRHSAEDPPTLSISPPLGSGERRLIDLNQARPHLPNAQRLLGVPWAGSVDALIRAGVWDRLVEKMMDTGFDSIKSRSQECLSALYEWEQKATVTMICGKGPFRTLWPTSK